MIKKTVIGLGAAMVLGGLVFGRDVFSYVRTAGASVRNAVKSEVPLEFEVERAREMVENLVPDIRRCMHVIAEQQVDVENLGESMQQRQAAMAKQKDAILALKTDLESGEKEFVYAGRSYSESEVYRDLAHRFDRFRAAEEALKRDRMILQHREQALRANQEKLDKMLAAKQDLEVQIEQLESRLKTVQAQSVASSLEFDDSQLTRAKTLIRELNKQLDVKVKLLDAEGKFTGLIPVETSEVPVDSDVVQEIDDYFGLESESDAEEAGLKSAAL